jgi:hypothetical protein
LSRILVPRQAINGFFVLMNRFIGQSPGGSTNTHNTEEVTGTVTRKVFNTSTLRYSLYDFGEQVCTQSPLGLGFYYSVGLSRLSSWVEFDITTDGQPASLSWNKAPIWGLRPDLDYCQTFAGLLMWGVPSDERTDLSFVIATGPGQRSHSRVKVPWDSRPHFNVSDSRLPFLSLPTSRRVTVEVFDPASTRVSHLVVYLSLR